MSGIKLVDRKVIPTRCWDYLVSFIKDDNVETLTMLYGCTKIEQLTPSQFWNFLVVAAQADVREFIKK